MEMFNIISGICSIVGLALSIFATTKVIKLDMSINSKRVTNNKNIHHVGKYTGGDSNGK
ncbi:hypothetical protein V6615_15240 [Oscillospiraceae bacterium PP1C4]